MEGLSTRLEPDGSVPPGLGGSIEQARQHLREAMTEIPEVMGAHPSIDVACRQLADILPATLARMTKIEGKSEWQVILTDLKHAENVAYAIPEAMYRRNKPVMPKDEQVIVVLTPEQKEILDTFTAAQKGEITNEEAQKRLAVLTSTKES